MCKAAYRSRGRVLKKGKYMKKRLISVLIAAAAAMFPLTALADYYPDTEFPDVYFTELMDEPVSMEDFNAGIDALRRAAEKGDQLTVLNMFNVLDTVIYEEQQAYALASLRSSQHNTEENNSAEAKILTDLNLMSETISNLLPELYNMPAIRPAIIELCGSEEAAREIIASIPGKRFYELSEQENKLLEEYSNNAPGTYVYQAEDGNSYTLQQITDKMTSLLQTVPDEVNDPDTDKEAYLNYFNEYTKTMGIYESYVTANGNILGDIYKRLVDVRREEAAEAGYDNYADYVYTELYGRDFTLEDSAKLREYTKKYIVPLYLSKFDYESYFMPSPITDDELIEVVGTELRDISPELGESFDYMVTHGFYDICRSEDRITPGTAYTTTFGDFIVPFTFISPPDESSNIWTLKTLVHEFGHFNAILRAGMAADDESISDEDFAKLMTGTANTDTGEVYSQGLEMLFLNGYHDIFGYNERPMQAEALQTMLSAIVEGCLMDEWQENVYKNPSMSVEEMEAMFQKLSAEYGMSTEYGIKAISRMSWAFIPHNFESPMYYISYAVSAAAALDIWVQSCTDRDGAVDRYMKFTADTAPGKFREALAKHGFGDIFSEDTIKGIAEKIDRFYTCGYTDVDKSDHAHTSVFATYDYFYRREQDDTFNPDEPVLRIEAAETLGRMYEYRGDTVADADAPFTDDNGSKYIAWLWENNIVSGYSETTLGAEDTLTRGQAAVMLHRFYEKTKVLDTPDLDIIPTDIDGMDSWMQAAAIWAVDSGTITPIDTESGIVLDPGRPVTRAEFAKWLYRLAAFVDPM